MGIFNLDSALTALGRGNSPIDSLGIAFGVPQCLLDLSKETLAVLPTPILATITNSLSEGASYAHSHIAELKRKLLMENGFMEIDTENGTFRFISDSSKNKIESSNSNKSSSLGDFLNAVGAAAQTGAELYTNYKDALRMITGIEDCINSYKTFLDLQNGTKSNNNDLSGKYALEIAQAKEAQDFIDKATRVIADASQVIGARIRNPSLEPTYNPQVVDPSAITTSSTPEEKPVFRLVFGPPKSKKGQFLLSVDGLYYDSQSGGLPTVSGVISLPDSYKFEFPANLGGKGQILSTKQLDAYIDTIFDLNTIDDSLEIKKHYDADHFLRVLIGQKNRHLYVVSGQMNAAINTGYSPDSAMLENLKQQLISVAAQHDVKINKRKKQIEIAVKAPLTFGASRTFKYGEIPVNDFSFLSKLNLSVAFEKQKKLTFKQGEVSGVVLPLQPKYVKASESGGSVAFNHLVVPPVGIGSILYSTSSGDVEQQILSLTDSIVTDQLIAVYNFLEADITYPGSDEFNVLNCTAKTNKEKAAQLVSKSASSVFNGLGLATPYLTGITERDTNGSVSSYGNYVQLPDIAAFQDWMYNSNGATFDSWVYIPGLNTSSTWGTSSYHKLLFACENIGGTNKSENRNNVQVSYGSDFIRGLVCGFTRDSYLTGASDNYTSAGMFYIAPVRSYNTSEVGFIRDTITQDCALPIYTNLKCSIPLSSTVNGKSFNNVSGGFCHVVITMEPKKDEIKIYLDSQLMTTSSLTNTFGSNYGQAIKIPSFIQSTSFGYSDSVGADFIYGPAPSSFTPWIIGGGFTDGLSNGFMGTYHGLESGLKGYIGSVKIYSKPLNSSEVLSNYNNQQGFFKNIDVN